jgi:hypothetical protein
VKPWDSFQGFFYIGPIEKLFFMKNYKQLIQVIETLETSSKWTGNYELEGYKKFVYIPRNGTRYTSLSIPLINNKPDLTREWIGRILTDQYILIQLEFLPTDKTWSHFTDWLTALVYNPNRLIHD